MNSKTLHKISYGMYVISSKKGDKPETEFNVNYGDIAAVREYCNIHGLWKEGGNDEKS